MKILLVINPIAGDTNKEPFLEYAREAMARHGISYAVYSTSGENDLEEILVSIEAEKPDRVAAAGGDGTLRLVAMALQGLDIPLGMIPFGSANGLSTELGISPDPKQALMDFLLSQITYKLDLIRVNGEHYCMHIGDVGINAAVVRDFENDERRGMLTYAKYFLSHITTSEPLDFVLTHSGQEITGKAYMIAIANSRKYGTGVVLNYHGDPGDGQFEINVILNKNPHNVILSGLSAINEEFSKELDIVTYHCKKAQLSFNSPQTLQLDGEVIGEVKTIDLEILPEAVTLITTGENPFL